MRIIEPSVQLIRHMPNCVEEAGRNCYQSEPNGTDFTKKILKLGHLAMIEFGYAVFRIITDRGITHELVRHRLASFAQESTRYCSYKEEISVVKPSGIAEGTNEFFDWESSCLSAERQYHKLIHLSPQVARSVLPTCLKTTLIMGANFREWLHILKLRNNKRAHPDMQIIAKMLELELQKLDSIFLQKTESSLMDV